MLLFCLFMLGITVFSLSRLATASASLARGIYLSSDIVIIAKGAFYGLGGIGALATAWCSAVLVFRKEVPELQLVWLGRLLIASVILMFTLPHAVHYPAAAYLESRGYKECEPQSQQWLHDRTIVYTQTSAQCVQLVIDECRKWPSSEQCGVLKKAGVPERLWRPERR